jgi:WD40 repeat protein
MAWPVPQDYNEAVQDPGTSFADPELRAGEAAANALGIPQPRSGNFADVYEFRCAGNSKWAVKCFTRQVHGLRERYAAISQHLQQAKLPFTVDFQYLEQGILVRGQWYPILKMRWVEGLTLNEFVRDALDKPALLDALGQIWLRMARRLREARMAHADLQHGNVLLVPGSSASSLAVKLIDYDGMWVPALAASKSGEVGHPAYQHPQRLREGIYDPEVDRFPLLVVAAALRCLCVGGKSLWERYDNGDNLLFRERDLAAPRESALFAELLKLEDSLARSLVTQLAAAAQKPLGQAPLLEELLPDKTTTTAKAGAAAGSTRAAGPAESAFRFADEEESSSRRKRGKRAKKSLAPLVAGGVGLAVLLIGGGVFLATRGGGSNKPAPASGVAQVNPDKGKKGPEGSGRKAMPPDTGKKNENPKDMGKTGTPEPAETRPAPMQAVERSAGPLGEVRRFTGDTGPNWGVAFAPDGRHVLSAGDRALVLWDADTGKEVRAFSGHQGRVWSVAISADGRQALSGGTDKTVRLWEVDSGRQLQLFQGHTDNVDAVAFVSASTHVCSASRDGTCRLWDTRTGSEVGRLGEGPLALYALAVSPKGQRALFAAGDNSVCVWDLEGKRTVQRLKGHTAHVYALAFSPNGKQAASSGGDRTIRLWDLESGAELRRMEKHTKPVQSLVFLPDGRLLSGSDDGTLRLWDPARGDELCRLEGHTDAVRSVRLSPDGRYAISAAVDQTVRLWRLPAPDLLADKADDTVGEVRKYEGHSACARRIALSVDGRRALTAGYDGSVLLWDLAKGEQVLRLTGHTTPEVHAVVFLPGNRALSAGRDKTLRLWDLGEGREIGQWAGHALDVFHLSVSADGRFVLSCGPENVAILWDVASGKPLHRLDVGGLGAPTGAFSADGRLAATLGNDGFVRVWETATGQELRRIERGRGGEGVAFSPDGRFLLAARDKTLGMWETETGKELLRLEGHTAGIFGVAFTPDGRRGISCSGDRSVRVWDLEAGKEAFRFLGHANMVGDITCLPDGQYVLSSSFDRTVRLWRLPPATLVVGTPLKIEPRVEPPVMAMPDKPSQRAPVPDEMTLAEAQKQVRDTYRADYTQAQRKPEEKLALAGKLLKLGQRPAETPALRYALLREACNLAAQVPDPAVSLKAIEELAKVYEISVYSLKADALATAAGAARTRESHKAVGESALAAAEEAVAGDEYPVALKLLTLAAGAAGKSGNVFLQAAVARRTTAAGRLQKEYDKVKDAATVLAERPKDPDAGRTVGRFRCFDKEDWEKGLPLLAQCSDSTLAEQARKDLAKPTEASKQVETAQGWWDLADKETGTAKTAMLRRAQFWYRQALPQLAGLEKGKVEARLKLVVGKVQLKPGLVAELFADGGLERKVKSRIDYRVDFNWGAGAPDEGLPPDNFSIRWRGYLIAPRPGVYTLFVFADDGARVYLDEKPVLDNWDKTGRYSTTVTLDDKPHRLRVEHHEGVGLAAMSFRWALDCGFAEQAVPLEALYHDLAQEKVLAK